jgi:succinylglutamate desuccinylase
LQIVATKKIHMARSMAEAIQKNYTTKEMSEIVRLAAFHEAGHAVVATALGVGVEYLSIDPRVIREHKAIRQANANVIGFVSHPRTRWSRDEARRLGQAQHRVMVCYAGAIAEKMAASRKWAAHIEKCAEEDRKAAHSYARLVAESHASRELLLAYLEGRAREIVEEEWCAVAAVAKALHFCSTLTGKDVEFLRRQAYLEPEWDYSAELEKLVHAFERQDA